MKDAKRWAYELLYGDGDEQNFQIICEKAERNKLERVMTSFQEVVAMIEKVQEEAIREGETHV